QDAARGVGINTTLVKLAAFGLSAMIGGFAGVVFSAFQRFVSPESFTFWESLAIVLIIVIGGPWHPPRAPPRPPAPPGPSARHRRRAGPGGHSGAAAQLFRLPHAVLWRSPGADHPAAAQRPGAAALWPGLADEPAGLALMLRFENVGKRFGALVAIDDVSLAF